MHKFWNLPLHFSRPAGRRGRHPIERPRTPASPIAGTRRVYEEFAGRGGIDATRYGDWEYSGRCTDF